MDKTGKKIVDPFIYKNVFTFPRNTYHIKYFEKNPHPYRFDDKLLALEEALPQKNLNVDYYQKKVEFEAVKKFLEPKLSAKDKRLMRLPKIFHEKIDVTTDPLRKLAYTHLRDSFTNFFSTPLDENIKPDIQWLDYALVRNFPPAQDALANLKKNLFNEKARNKLVEKLREAGAFANERRDFYFWNTSPHNWPDISYQSAIVEYEPLIGNMIYNRGLTPQYLALGQFTINAIPEGYVQPRGNGKYDIYVTKMYYFINDVFNFEGKEPLGAWEIHPQYHDHLPLPNQIIDWVENKDLREFRRHGYGRYFPVISRLQEMDDFSPVPLEYPHVK